MSNKNRIMRVKINAELCATVASAATQIGYVKGRQGHAQLVFDIVVLTHPDISMRTLRKCLQQFAQFAIDAQRDRVQLVCNSEGRQIAKWRG
jgi:hypothetical protein